MKKVYSVLIALILILGLFSSIAYAQSGNHDKIDLTDYSLEELVELNEEVHAELTERLYLGDDTLIGRSEYTVGTQIKPGNYTFTVVETESYDDGEPDNFIFVQDISSKEYPSTTYNAPLGGKVVLTLKEGQKLIISNCVCSVTVSNPIWAP